jgi:NAD(P)-dependent dehydrogenase (short-subunit alcohol dehydrogenase family)
VTEPAAGPAVLVTGASSGIGAADGAALAARASARLTPLPLDVTDADQIAAAVATVEGAVGAAGLAGLINNAGIAVAGPLEYLPIAAFRRQLEVNVTGQVAVTQACLPLLRRGRGRIITLGSIAGRVAAPFTGPYHASKFALRAVSDSLRVELRPWGIPVVLIEPGVIDTPIWTRAMAAAEGLAADYPPEAWQRYGAIIERMRSRPARAARQGLPATAVAAVVVTALTTPRPRPRYLVGHDARLAALVALLPDRLRDWLLSARVRRYR